MSSPPSLRDVARSWKGCKKCGLHKNRKHLVLGAGSRRSDIMIISEGPGEEENKYGWPFIGKSGDVITQLMHDAGLLCEVFDDEDYADLQAHTLPAKLILDARRNLFITNMVACWTGEGNRDPSAPEMEACWPRLAAQIYAVDPLIILSVGKVATEFLIGRSISITEDHGTIYDAVLPGLFRPYTIPVMALLHPSYLMRNADYGPKGIWAQTCKEMQLALYLTKTMRRAYRGADVASCDPREDPGA